MCEILTHLMLIKKKTPSNEQETNTPSRRIMTLLADWPGSFYGPEKRANLLPHFINQSFAPVNTFFKSIIGKWQVWWQLCQSVPGCNRRFNEGGDLIHSTAQVEPCSSWENTLIKKGWIIWNTSDRTSHIAWNLKCLSHQHSSCLIYT